MFALLVAGTTLDVARELPGALVSISRAPSFVGTCDAAEVIELGTRLGATIDCVPGQFAPRGVLVTSWTDIGFRMAVYDSDGEHVIAPWLDVTWRTPSQWWPDPKLRVIDLDGDGVDEIVWTELALTRDPSDQAHDVRVYAVEHGQLVVVATSYVKGDELDAIEAARLIYHRARE